MISKLVRKLVAEITSKLFPSKWLLRKRKIVHKMRHFSTYIISSQTSSRESPTNDPWISD